LVLLLLTGNLNEGIAQEAFSGGQVLNTSLPASSEAKLVARDEEGFYWLGGSSGLYRFDGQQSKHYTIRGLNDTITHDQYVVSSGFIDEEDVLWFSTYMALHSFDPVKEEFASYQVAYGSEMLRDNYSPFFLDTIKNELLLRAGPCLWSFSIHEKTFRLLRDSTQANSIASVRIDKGTGFWGAPWWNNKASLEYHEYSLGGIAESQTLLAHEMVKEVVVYRPDSIFVCTLSSDRNTLFASISGKGILSVDTKHLRVKSIIDSLLGLSDNNARTLRTSEDGLLFVSHRMHGLDVVLPPVQNIFFRPGPTGKNVEDIIELTSGDLLLNDHKGGFWKGEARNDNMFTWEKVQHEGEQERATTLARLCRSTSGELYALGLESLLRLNDTGELEKVDSLKFSLYRGIISPRRDELIFLRMNKVMMVEGDRSPQPLPGISFSKDDYFTTIMKVSADRFLLCYREVELWDVVRNGDNWKVQAKNPLPGEMLAIAPVGDKIYIGTSAGLLELEKGKLSESFNPISTNGSLWINALHADENGRVWLGTRRGIFCYKPVEDEYLFFGKNDGVTDDWFVHANVIVKDDRFTMATRTGLVTVNPQLADEKVSANNIYLSDIWINGIRQTEHSLYAPKSLELDYLHNSISFLPGMIELSSSNLSGFHYQMIGLEDSVIYSKTGETIRYPSLPYGDYTFRFYGIDKNGRTTEPMLLPVRIFPPFYQTWWFWALCITVLTGFFFYSRRRAVRRETARQEVIRAEEARIAEEKLARHKAVVAEQRRIMMELHDDLGGTLGSLFYTLDGYLLDQESGLTVEPDFEMLKNASGDAMKQLREVMKSNVAREMSLPVFVRTLTEQARAMAISSRLEWELEKDSQFPQLQLSSQQVHNALLVSKEGLQNIRKHAKATSFSLKLHLQGTPDNLLSITLTDNGIGVGQLSTEHREDGTGNGLRNMQRRAKDLGGNLTISNLPEGGAQMKLSFPLKDRPSFPNDHQARQP